ncbi:DUF2281 domain-containing protein [Scytonema sp. UIC 10036]|uniref:DUF2281 domain-containing protein n=1 Tax=Scytonema sp. UIC 10036 TaxID=2304196 RepID=UPI00325BD68B
MVLKRLMQLYKNGLIYSIYEYWRQSGSAKGLIWMSDDFDTPLEELREYIVSY